MTDRNETCMVWGIQRHSPETLAANLLPAFLGRNHSTSPQSWARYRTFGTPQQVLGLLFMRCAIPPPPELGI